VTNLLFPFPSPREIEFETHEPQTLDTKQGHQNAGGSEDYVMWDEDDMGMITKVCLRVISTQSSLLPNTSILHPFSQLITSAIIRRFLNTP
jgi:hypothetical protein